VCEVIDEIEHTMEFPEKLHKIELALAYINSAIMSPLQSETAIEGLLKALETDRDQDQRFKELLDRLEAFILDLEQEQIEDCVMKENINELAKYIKDPELNIKNRLVCTIPLIPVLLTYQGIIEYQNGINLLAAWNKLTNKFRY